MHWKQRNFGSTCSNNDVRYAVVFATVLLLVGLAQQTRWLPGRAALVWLAATFTVIVIVAMTRLPIE